MRRGRPPLGPALVEKLDGPTQLKNELAIILETIASKRTIESACAKLGIGRSRFHELRTQVLQAALGGLEAGTPGRPPKAQDVDPNEVERLRRENEDLQLELDAAFARTELALAMPHLLKRELDGTAAGQRSKKKAQQKSKERRRKKRRSRR